MNLFKKLVLLSFILLSFGMNNPIVAQNNQNTSLEKTPPPVDFNGEEIEKIKTLIEQHLKTRISEAEFSMMGKANEENLALFKLLDETKKESPFFSQPHISYIIESMEERMGFKKPKSRLERITSQKELPHNPKVSKLPKGKSDNF